jgi:hypothetical protein
MQALYQEFVTIIQLIGENVGIHHQLLKKQRIKTIEHI